MPANTSNEVALRSSREVAAIEELEGILLGNVPPPDAVDEDPEVIARQIVERILAAESDAELEQFGNTIGWRDLMNVPVRIAGFVWRPTQYDEGGAPIFFVVQGVRLDTGEAVTLTTGSYNVLAQLANMAKRGTLEGAVREMVPAEKQTKRGFTPLWLRTPPEYLEAAADTDAA